MITMWVIYDHPTDFPRHYVARRHFLSGSGVPVVDPTAFVRTSLEELRECLPPGLHRLGAFPDDDPKILEVWL